MRNTCACWGFILMFTGAMPAGTAQNAAPNSQAPALPKASNSAVIKTETITQPGSRLLLIDETKALPPGLNPTSKFVTVKKVFAPRYEERIRDYEQQLQAGVIRGWLTADQAANFQVQLQDLRRLDAAAKAHGYERAMLDNLDQQFTLFNASLSAAMQPRPAAAPAKEDQREPAKQ